MENLKLLIVDDTEESRAFIAMACAKIEGLEIDQAENGAIAVEKAQSRRYDLVLMDIMMPVMDGYEATRRVKEISPDTIVIIITAVVNYAMEDSTRRYGASSYIQKPFESLKFVRAKIENFVNFIHLKHNALGDDFLSKKHVLNPFSNNVRAIRSTTHIVSEDDFMDFSLWLTQRYMYYQKSQSIAFREANVLLYNEVGKAIKRHIPTMVFVEESFDALFLMIQINGLIAENDLTEPQREILGKYIQFDEEFLYIKIDLNAENDKSDAPPKDLPIIEDPNKKVSGAIKESEEIAESFVAPPKQESAPEPVIETPSDQTGLSKTDVDRISITDAVHSQTRVADDDEQRLLRQSYADKISAEQYCSTLTSVDFEVVQDMSDLDAELLDIMDTPILSPDETRQIGEIFQRYAGIISQLYEFAPLSYALSSLGALFSHADEEALGRLNPDLIAVLLRGIYEDINKWRLTIFSWRSTADIHYLDASLLSSCMQIESMLLNYDVVADDDSGELELF
ncbi:MAG: response regulator [Helicobacteraceae bacterium]|nr:response regulator [Helicobacteraceae bacterium]